MPLLNAPELLSAYWRTDFDRNPTTDDVTRDGTNDWATASGGAFSGACGRHLAGCGAIESRPKSNFTAVTTVEARCRNTGTGGNGSGAPHPGRPARRHPRAAWKFACSSRRTSRKRSRSTASRTTRRTCMLFQRKNLSSDFVRLRLTILPANNVVNLADQRRGRRHVYVSDFRPHQRQSLPDGLCRHQHCRV